MRYLYLLWSFISITVLLGGCKGYYNPANIPVPLLKEKGELQLTAGLGNDGFDADAAYALTDHIGLTGGYTYEHAPIKLGFDYDIGMETYHLGHVGIGYGGISMGKSSFFMEIYGGTRQGYYQFDNFESAKYYDSWISQYYIQPSIGMRSDIFDISFTSRFIYHRVFDIQNFFIEPFITMKLGYKFLKFYTQIGLCMGPDLKINDHIVFGDLSYPPFLGSFGLQVDLFTGTSPND